ncbi:type II toxin-antitoxin system RelE/ParE family toxin [Candidatus Peregrinibacteria bacterium]|nr:type II toxin-antitoxin system RelE/ParE family toxin [Candidatus Peregrinibacteria bacterium]
MAYKKQYRFEWSRRVEKDFAKLDKTAQRFVLRKIEQIEKSVADPLKDAAKIVNFKNLYRYRFGDYRVIFAVNEGKVIDILVIHRIQHRKDAYKDL